MDCYWIFFWVSFISWNIIIPIFSYTNHSTEKYSPFSTPIYEILIIAGISAVPYLNRIFAGVGGVLVAGIITVICFMILFRFFRFLHKILGDTTIPDVLNKIKPKNTASKNKTKKGMP